MIIKGLLVYFFIWQFILKKFNKLNQLPSVTPLVIGDWIGAWEFFKEQFISGLYKPPFTLKDVKIKGGYGMKSRIKNF